MTQPPHPPDGSYPPHGPYSPQGRYSSSGQGPATGADQPSAAGHDDRLDPQASHQPPRDDRSGRFLDSMFGSAASAASAAPPPSYGHMPPAPYGQPSADRTFDRSPDVASAAGSDTGPSSQGDHGSERGDHGFDQPSWMTRSQDRAASDSTYGESYSASAHSSLFPTEPDRPPREERSQASAPGSAYSSSQPSAAETSSSQAFGSQSPASGQPSYGPGSQGAGSYGERSYGERSYGQDSFGGGTYGQGSLGGDSYGQAPAGQSTTDQSTLDPHRPPASYGSASYGSASYGSASSVPGQGSGGPQGSVGQGQNVGTTPGGVGVPGATGGFGGSVGSGGSGGFGGSGGSGGSGGFGGSGGSGGFGGPGGPGGPFGGGPNLPEPLRIPAPTPFNGATIYGIRGQRGIRHPQEIPLLIIAAVLTLAAYVYWWILTIPAIRRVLNGEDWSVNTPGNETLANIYVTVGAAPLIYWIFRALNYAALRASATRMSPTQFPQGYRMVVEAAEQFGLRRVPDAYVQLGNGTINAFASGHGFRRFVLVTSDLFEVGGKVRDPDALRFVIAHEVGHLAAGHVSYFRLLFTNVISQVPVLGPAFSRAQEYTADNFGYRHVPQGAPGTMAVLAAGKYLNADVNVNELADRAATEKGFWLHVTNWMSSHPITTWRTYALRDRSRPGRIWFRPKFAWFRVPLPSGSERTDKWPTPGEVLLLLDRADEVRPAGMGNQFGRFPGVDYAGEPTVREVQTAAPLLSTRNEQPPLGPPPGQPGQFGQQPPSQFGPPRG